MRRLMDANQAVAKGAMDAGLKIYAGYPITPATEIFEYLAVHLPRHGGIVVQTEDELAAINLIVGASLAGARSMTATSGPGFSLMLEGLSMAVMLEAPIVIAYVMRAGPSTGIATGCGQGDVMQARWGAHGPYELIVLAPWSAQEAYDLTIEAFRLSERYRVPTILLTDMALAHTKEPVVTRGSALPPRPRCRPPDPERPYKPGPDLVPPLVHFGEGLRLFAETLCHDERGAYNPRPEVYEALVRRLSDKIRYHAREIASSECYFCGGHQLLLVAYGSLARSAYVVVTKLRQRGIRAALFRPRTLWPLDEWRLREAAEDADYVVVAEMNNGQLVREVERVLRRDAVFVAWLRPEPPRPKELMGAVLDACGGNL